MTQSSPPEPPEPATAGAAPHDATPPGPVPHEPVSGPPPARDGAPAAAKSPAGETEESHDGDSAQPGDSGRPKRLGPFPPRRGRPVPGARPPVTASPPRVASPPRAVSPPPRVAVPPVVPVLSGTVVRPVAVPARLGAGPRGPGGRRYAGRAERFFAKLVDRLVVMSTTLIIDALTLVGISVGTGEVFVAGSPWYSLLTVMVVGTATYPVVSYRHFVRAPRRTGQTLGKRLLGIRAARLADGGVPTTSELRRRWLADDLVTAGLFIPGLNIVIPIYLVADGIAMIADGRQALHDKTADTTVVKLRPGEAPEQGHR